MDHLEILRLQIREVLEFLYFFYTPLSLPLGHNKDIQLSSNVACVLGPGVSLLGEDYCVPPDHHWDPHRGGGDGGDRPEDASILPLRKHGQPHQPHRNDRWKGPDQRLGVHLPVKPIRLLISRLAAAGLKRSPNVVLQVSAVCRERRPPVSFRVPGSRHHERKEGTHEGVVSVQEAHGRTRHSKSLNYSRTQMVGPPVCCF